MKKALIAMSGGVDSSVAAHLVKMLGYECVGATMRLYVDCESKACGSENDITDARAVCEKMNMEHKVFDFTEEFKTSVIDKFSEDYIKGLTPNPCINCNRYLKWDKMFREMEEIGADFVVTGHYARIVKDEKTGKFLLKKGLDPQKDQSYVLYNMTQYELSHTLLPLGELSKPQVREIAEEIGLETHAKKDSQDICFVPDGDYAAFIERQMGCVFPEGDFVDTKGHVLGRHKGLIRYTIGQRRGLGLALKSPGYVCRKDLKKNRVIIGSNDDLFTRRLVADDFNWNQGEAPKDTLRLLAKTRYRHQEQPALVTPLANGRVEVLFDEPQRAITEGQAVVLYDGDTVIGGGRIIKTEDNL